MEYHEQIYNPLTADMLPTRLYQDTIVRGNFIGSLWDVHLHMISRGITVCLHHCSLRIDPLLY